MCFAMRNKGEDQSAVTTDIISHDAAHVIYAIKALDSLVCMFVLMLVSHETAMVTLIFTRHSDKMAPQALHDRAF